MLQELEDTQRLHAVQKRALKDALVAAADKEASMAVADEMKQAATHQALEDEVEFLAEVSTVMFVGTQLHCVALFISLAEQWQYHGIVCLLHAWTATYFAYVREEMLHNEV